MLKFEPPFRRRIIPPFPLTVRYDQFWMVDTSLYFLAPRMWALSLLFSLAGSATNLFFSLRYPSVSITPVIALVLVHPLGKLWDVFLKRKEDPPEVFENGALQRRKWPAGDVQEAKLSRGQRIRLWLAQGCWNEKEHACVYISSNVSFGFAFATDVRCLSKFPSDHAVQ